MSKKASKSIKADEVKVWLPRLTRYERARIIGARALQIAMGAPILIPVPPEGADPIKIAMMELEMGLLPITVRRRLPDGRYQDIPLSWLLEGRGGGLLRLVKRRPSESASEASEGSTPA